MAAGNTSHIKTWAIPPIRREPDLLELSPADCIAQQSAERNHESNPACGPPMRMLCLLSTKQMSIVLNAFDQIFCENLFEVDLTMNDLIPDLANVI